MIPPQVIAYLGVSLGKECIGEWVRECIVHCACNSIKESVCVCVCGGGEGGGRGLESGGECV